jgi:hypothetical protein
LPSTRPAIEAHIDLASASKAQAPLVNALDVRSRFPRPLDRNNLLAATVVMNTN